MPGSYVDRFIALITELKQSPATAFELSAAIPMNINHVRTNVRKLREAGLVEFDGFDANGKPGRNGYQASKWKWKD